ncbi:MAG: stage 0 sporulation family protein [Tissierellia bacterium]|nr:stage 0 sporulation family protein [Tissierellia bacterium]
MIQVVGVRFKPTGKIYYFDPGDLYIKLNDDVIVETARGMEFGQVVIDKRDVSSDSIVGHLKPVIRVATDQDLYFHLQNDTDAKSAFKTCEELILDHGLDMKLIDCEYTFDRGKLLFYFTADGRIDFRMLVRDLASVFRTRIELRQIGVRDEAKVVGGLGCCGRECCCSSFLSEFTPVSIKMAKDQNLSLNPVKISGVCGRLMCCLKYEQDGYECILKKIPKIGEIVLTEHGEGTVSGTYVIQEMVKVREVIDGDTVFNNYDIKEIKRTHKIDSHFFHQEDEDEDDSE